MGADRMIGYGSTDVFHTVVLRDVTDVAFLSGQNASSITCSYMRDGASATVIPVLSSGTLGVHADNTWVATSAAGFYQLCLPDAAYASGTTGLTIGITNASAVNTSLSVSLNKDLYVSVEAIKVATDALVTVGTITDAYQDGVHGTFIFTFSGTPYVQVGQKITVVGSDSNDGVYTVRALIENESASTWSVDIDEVSGANQGALGSLVFINSAPSATGGYASSVTVQVKIGDTAVSGASVWITEDSSGSTAVAGPLTTDASGNATFLLNVGTTYYLWASKSGINAIQGQSFVAVAD